jgi:hypothetical protein
MARLAFGADGDIYETAGPLPAKGRMTIPCRWREGGLGDFAGRVRFRRRFGWLANVAPHERVWLTFGGVDGSAEVCLNGRLLGAHCAPATPFEFEVTSFLGPRNELVVLVESSGRSGGLSEEVALEVRCSAYLRAIRWRMNIEDGRDFLQVSGEVVGSAERPLELYALIDGSTAIYSTVDPSPTGQPFSLKSEPIRHEASRERRVRIELVNGAVRWYYVEGIVEPTGAPSD